MRISITLRWSVLGLLATAVAIGLFQPWREQPPLLVGFIGGISGRVADLGMAGRDGAILALEECNAAGGIGGRPLKLLVRDDRQDAAAAHTAINDLVERGVTGIIGPMTSAMAVEVAPIADHARIPLVSPSVSTTTLTGKDDYFFRVYPDSSQETPQLAQLAVEQLHLKRISILCDLSNRAYSLNWADWFSRDFAARGGVVADRILYQSAPDILFAELADQLLASQPDGILLLTNAVDTALAAQKIRQLAPGLPLLVSEWSTTQELIDLGGRAIEGIIFLHTYNPALRDPAFLQFKAAFEKRFGYDGGFPAIKGYDAATLLIRGLRAAPEPAKLKDGLLTIEGFAGLQNQYRFDRFGDVQQQGFRMIVRNGRFVPLEPE